MREALKERLRRNWIELKNTDLFNATDTFFQDGDITEADHVRILCEPTPVEKNDKLLKILHTKPDTVFDKILKWLKNSGHEYLFDNLKESDDTSQIDKEFEKINQTILLVLNEKFETVENAYTDLDDVVEILHTEIRHKGEYMTPDHIHKRLKTILRDQISYFEETKRKRKGRRRLIIEKLRLKVPEAGKETAAKECPDTVQDEKETSQDGSEREGFSDQTYFTEMTVFELTNWLEPILKANSINLSIIEKFRDEEVDGKAFENMTDSELKSLFPELKWGKRKNILVDRDKQIKKSSSLESKSTETMGKRMEQSDNAQRVKEDSLRTFGKLKSIGDKYTYGAKIPETENRVTDKISPVHKFVSLPFSANKDKKQIHIILNEMVKYASACMNERTNGTIHFGITNETIEGFQIDDTNKYAKAITNEIQRSFFEEQVETALRCIRPPQFIPILGSKYCNPFVIEIDVVPSSNIIGNEGFFVRSSHSDGEFHMFRIDANGQIVEIKGPDIQKFMTEKQSLTAERANAEKQILGQNRCCQDLRRNLQEFLCNSGEYLEGDIYPLLFLTPTDKDMDREYLRKNFDFIKNLDARAIFDFDHKLGENSLSNSLSEKGEVFMSKVVNDFDDSKGLSRKHIEKTLEDIKDSTLKTWIHCNGFEDRNIRPLEAREWTREQTKGFRQILNFYKEQIPPARARVIILLMSKDFEVISEAIREISLLFPEQWIVLAENDSIASSWKDSMLRYHSTCVDKNTLDSNCLVGISWHLINLTILQFTGNNAVSTEIPTEKGAFIEIPERLKNDLCDIQILGRNECENEQTTEQDNIKHRKEVEEDFYRGIQVNWWNFYYQGQVLVRKDHRVFLDCITDALKGAITFGENIARAVIYHQPGAGGSTSARQVLWDLRTQYPCCLVNRITDQTADQIQRLRTFANDEYPKPPLILLDNEDDESIEKLTDDLQRIAKEESARVFCLLLLCCRQVQLPFERCPIRMTLKHELSSAEKNWFKEKNKELHVSYKDRKGINPNHLIAFNIMKSNFNMDAIQRTIRDFVDAIPESEREFLLYLAFTNAYDIDFEPIPISCFDPLMCKTLHMKILGKGWEQRLAQSIRVLLNRSQRPGRIGGKTLSVRIISQLVSKEILKYLMIIKSLDLSQIACSFLESGMFERRNAINESLFKRAAALLKKRRWTVKKEDGQDKAVQYFLAPVLQEIFDDKNESGAVKVVELGYEVLEDPFIAQQAARLHMELRNMDRAEEFIEKAINQLPNNSYLYHTYGTLGRTRLLQIYRQACEQKMQLSPEETANALDLAQNTIAKYTQVEIITKKGSHGSTINPFGLIGILETVTYLLDTLNMSQCFKSFKHLHQVLVEKDAKIDGSDMIEQHNILFLRNLQRLSDDTLATLESDLSTAQYERQTEQKNILSFRSSGCLEKLKFNLIQYFGESRDEIPATLSNKEKAWFRRRRTKSLNCSSLIAIIKQKNKATDSVKKALKHVYENIESLEDEYFDYLIAISCILKLECDLWNSMSSEIPFSKCQSWSSKLYGKKQQPSSPSFEASLFVVILNWPQPVGDEPKPVSHDTVWRAMMYMLELSDSQKKRRKKVSLFFIGKGEEYKRVVLSHALRLHETLRSKNPYRSKMAFDNLRRFDGLLHPGGNKVSVNFQYSSSPGALQIDLPLAERVSNPTVWNKHVRFVVGLGQAGIHAYDITTDKICDLQKQVFDGQLSQREASRFQQKPCITTQSSKNPEVSFRHHDRIQKLQKRFWELCENMKLCKTIQQLKELQREKTIVETQLRWAVESRIAEVESSRNISY